VGRAGVRLLETLDEITALPPAVWQSWIEFVTTLIQHAVTDGGVVGIVGACCPARRRRRLSQSRPVGRAVCSSSSYPECMDALWQIRDYELALWL
jgi:hypothetical protein